MTLNERIAKAKRLHYSAKWDGADARYWSKYPADAHELVEELVSEGAYVCIESPTRGVKEDGDTTWRCSIEMPDERMISADASTMAEAVCEAWLAVKE